MTIDDASSALSRLRSTLLILGTKRPDGPHYMVANWGVQASFDPWRFVMMLKRSSHTRHYAKTNGAFTVNLLDASQKALAAGIQKAKGEGHGGEGGALDAPRLPEAFAGFDCKVLEERDIGGDHLLFVCDIVDGWSKSDGPALMLADIKQS